MVRLAASLERAPANYKLEIGNWLMSQIAKGSGDRNRDMPDEIREVVIERLLASKLAPAWAQMVSDVVELDNASVQQALGESLPPGLKLLG
jgi:hypothetical protein